MTKLEVLLLLWVGISILVGCVFALLAMTGRDADEWDRLARQSNRFTLVDGGSWGRVCRPRPFDWQNDDRSIA